MTGKARKSGKAEKYIVFSFEFDVVAL